MPAAQNLFTSFAASPIGPAVRTQAIAPSDTEDLPYVSRRIYVGTGGDVVTIDTYGNTVTHKNVPSGSYLGDAFFTRVKATGTTAADLVAYV